MSRTPQSIVQQKLRTCFPDEASALQAMEMLRRYGTEPHETGCDRVYLAILKLSSGDLDKLRYYLGVAKSDWRDVVAMAEYPEMMQTGVQFRRLSRSATRAMRERDLAQYREWLRSRGC